MERNEVYAMIDGERAYQQAQGKPDERLELEWLKSIDYYSKAAWRDVHANFPGHVRKIAALCVAALEQYGCPPREGYEPQPAASVPQPDWAQAPKWAQWWAVDPDGSVMWYEEEPLRYDTITYRGWGVNVIYGAEQGMKLGENEVDIPLGIDWRLLKQQRPSSLQEPTP